MLIRYKRLSPLARPPYQASQEAAGFDLTAISKTIDEANNCVIYGTGLALEIPPHHVGLLFPRSSVFKSAHILANCVGVIDPDYRGEVKVIYRTIEPSSPAYAVGDRVAQLIIMPLPVVEYLEADTLEETERGEKGYGSTGL